ncbi:uncharacterized protein METZ01_LOCUS445797, partial [marine metagenome]
MTLIQHYLISQTPNNYLDRGQQSLLTSQLYSLSFAFDKPAIFILDSIY